MKTIAPGIQQWSWFSDEKQLDFNGLLLTINDHCILVDPPPLQPEDRTAILKSPRIDYVLITNRDHAREAGEYRAPSLDTEGFIHCPLPTQVTHVADWFYRDVPDLVLLCVDPAELTSELRWEPSSGKFMLREPERTPAEPL